LARRSGRLDVDLNVSGHSQRAYRQHSMRAGGRRQRQGHTLHCAALLGIALDKLDVATGPVRAVRSSRWKFAERCLGRGRKDTVAFSEVLRGLVGLAERRSIDDEPLGT
jgi:hypothetical protein